MFHIENINKVHQLTIKDVTPMSIDILYVSIGQRFGPEQVAVNLLRNMFRMRDPVVHGFVDGRVAKALPSQHRKYVKVLRNLYSLSTSLSDISLRYKPKICHFNFPPLHPLLLPVLLLMKTLGIKIVYSFHGGILFERKSSFSRGIFLCQCEHLYDAIITNSRSSAGHLLRVSKNLEKKIAVIPNGIDISEFSKKKSTILEGEPSLLYVGRLDHIKGVDILVRALQSVKADLPEICLHIVGKGSQENQIRKLLISQKLENNVKLHGHMNHEEITKLYMAADIVVVPSRDETFGITVLEAMAAGKPLIVSNRGALPELVEKGRNGLVVDLFPDTMANAIVSLSNDKDLMARMTKTNKLKAKSYTWSRISRRYIGLYNELRAI